MKITFEATKGRLKNLDKYETAIHIIEFESQQGFFKARFDTEFVKFSPKSPTEDAKKVDLYIVKVYGRGVYRLTGNLGYNSSTKTIKFYTTAAEELPKFTFEPQHMFEVINDGLGTYRNHNDELQKIVQKLKETKPKKIPYNGKNSKPKKTKKKVDPRRKAVSPTQKAKTEKKYQSKNYKTDSRRKVSNNKKATR